MIIRGAQMVCSRPKKIFVTGGAGYIGSHTCVELINAGYEVVVYDNFSNSHEEAMKRVKDITLKNHRWINGDIRDECKLAEALDETQCDSVIHFAGLKSVADSSKLPLEYYDNNVHGTLCLLRAAIKCDVKKIVFSSSATVYGNTEIFPITEDQSLSATNPYGRTKLIIEEVLRDLYFADPKYEIIILRYFNPVGAHESGLIGEDPIGAPNNLMPIIAQAAVGLRDFIEVYGNDYPTHDGTCIRDYIHVVDLARGHIKALERLDHPQCVSINLGTGKGYSVLEVINAFQQASNRKIKIKFSPRRVGDVASCYAATELATSYLKWSASKNLIQMCTDTWKWQQANPFGYKKIH